MPNFARFGFVISVLVSACASDTDGPRTGIDASIPDGGAIDLAVAPDGAAMDLVTAEDAAVVPDLGTDSGVDASAVDSAVSPCGECPTGYTCGTANGIAVCRSPSGIPLFSHIFVFVMENTTRDRLESSGAAPYLASLEASGASSSNYHGTDHPSLPNYIAMTSGIDTSGIGCDCNPTGSECNALTCNAILHSCGCPQDVPHLGDQLDARSLSWRNYGEDMGSACNVSGSGDYAPKHVPFLYYPSVQTDAARCAAHVVDYSEFAADLASSPMVFSLIAPNLVHDMHDPFPAGDTNITNGDSWLEAELADILASPAYTDRGVIMLVWDEDDLSGALAADDPIPFYLLSPLAKHGGYVSDVHADHLALLATWEDGLALPRLATTTSATPMADFFPAE